MRLLRNKKRNGVAIIIALFTVFAILTMGVTYIGLSFTNSRASAGYEKEAMAIAFANSGLEFAINLMGRGGTSGAPAEGSWEDGTSNASKVGIALREISHTSTGDVYGSRPFFSIAPATADANDIWHGMATLNPYIVNYGMEINTASDSLSAYGINGNPGLYGQWSILVFPEDYSGGVPRYNINYRIMVKAWIRDGSTSSAPCVSSREVMARVSSEFPGSIYENLRSYDACGGFGYPNDTECTSDAVFVTEDFTWDGGIRIDGAATDSSQSGVWRSGRPWSAPDASGWASKDTSGSLRISLLDSTVSSDEWPHFDGKVVAHNQGGGTTHGDPVASSTTEGTSGYGIYYDQAITDTSEVFGNSKDPYQVNVPSMNIMNTIWVANDGTNQQPKLGYLDGSNNAQDGYFEGATNNANGTAAGFYIEAGDDSLRPDAFSGFSTYEAPTYRVTVIPLTENVGGVTQTTASGFFVQELYRDTTTGELTPDGTSHYFWVKNDTPDLARTAGNTGGVNWDQVLYVKGGNVQVCGGRTRALSDGSPNATDSYATLVPDDGVPGDGNLTIPVSIVADTNIQRERDSHLSQVNSTTSGVFDSQLTTVNVWDSTSGKYVYQCYDNDNGNRVFTGTSSPTNDEPVWNHTIGELNTLVTSDPNRYQFKYPPPPESVNQQPEGNLSVVGDLTYRKGLESPSLGLLAKNHVLLNDFAHPDKTAGDTIADPPVEGTNDNQILSLDATIGSQNHSMQMDFFNSSHKTYDKIKPRASDGTPIAGQVATSDPPPPSVAGAITSVKLQNADGSYRNVNKWQAGGMQQARDQYWQDFWFGSDQTCNSTWKNYNYLYQQGEFKFNGSIIAKFADVEADAKGTDPNTNMAVPGLGYIYQNIGYDPNLKNRSAPYFSTSCYNKTAVTSAIYWSVLTYVDKGALSEVNSY